MIDFLKSAPISGVSITLLLAVAHALLIRTTLKKINDEDDNDSTSGGALVCP